jgi:hypothetical protein
MTTGTRVLLTLIIGFSVLVAASVGVTAAAIYHSGMISVAVQDSHGAQYDVDLPAGVVNVAFDMLPTDLVDEAFHAGGLPVEIESMLPSARAAWKAFEASPDFVLLDLQSPDEQVFIEKTGRLLHVRIDSDDQNIDVSVPLKTLRKLLR